MSKRQQKRDQQEQLRKKQQQKTTAPPPTTTNNDVEDDDDIEYDEFGELIIKNKPQKNEDENSGDEDNNSKNLKKDTGNGQKVLSEKEKKKLKKQMRAGKMTMEEYEKMTGKFKEKAPVLTVEEQEKLLKQQEKESGLIGMTSNVDENSMGKDIHISNFTISYKGQTLLEDTALHLAHGRKYGIIGPNGTGKSTLLRHIAQRHLRIQKHISILYVEQEVEGTSKSALQSVVEADEERMRLLTERDTLEPISKQNSDEGVVAQERLLEIYDRLKEIKAYSAEHRASLILSGLGFTEDMKAKATQQFSGGWRMRISLARALFYQPDLLLLDEPSNHLDLDACIWLEEYLRKWKKTLVVVSHDREFLNWVCTDIIHLSHKKLDYYKGNYEGYLAAKEQKKREKIKIKKKQDREMEEINSKQDLNSRKKKKKLEKREVEKLSKDYRVRFTFFDVDRLDGKCIDVQNMSFGYDDQENLFEGVNLSIDKDSKIGIVGPNGVGKSTLVSLVIGELEPTEGEIIINRKLKIAKFSQHFVDQLTLTDTPIKYIQKQHPTLDPQEIRGKLGMYGLPGNMHEQPISLLSGGQKSRTILASLSINRPHIYFFDEPTNHLDMESVDALGKALSTYNGGIIIISHDQRLLTTICNEIWVLRGDKDVEIYDGTFLDYKQEIIDKMDPSLFDEEQFIGNKKN